MKIEFDLSDKGMRMIKALQVLSGDDSSNISQYVTNIIEDGLKTRILEEIGIEFNDQLPMVSTPFIQTQPPYPPPPTITTTTVSNHSDTGDVSELSDGLGDKDDSVYPTEDLGETTFSEEQEIVQGLKDAEGLVPASGGLDDNSIAKDMSVSDPGTEAKVDSPLWKESASAQAEADQHPEETFSQMALSMPFPAGEEQDTRAAKRGFRNPRARRAKVVGWTGDNSVEVNL